MTRSTAIRSCPGCCSRCKRWAASASASRSGWRSCFEPSPGLSRYPGPMKEIRGVITAMATPFEEGGEVDEAAALKLATYLLEHGSHGLVISGSTGEAPTLTDEEALVLLRALRKEV